MWKSTLLSSRQVFLNDKYSCQHSQHHFYPPPQQQQEQLQDNTFLAVFHSSSSTQIHFSFLTSLFANKYECIKLHHHPWRGYPLKVTWFFLGLTWHSPTLSVFLLHCKYCCCDYLYFSGKKGFNILPRFIAVEMITLLCSPSNFLQH